MSQKMDSDRWSATIHIEIVDFHFITQKEAVPYWSFGVQMFDVDSFRSETHATIFAEYQKTAKAYLRFQFAVD